MNDKINITQSAEGSQNVTQVGTAENVYINYGDGEKSYEKRAKGPRPLIFISYASADGGADARQLEQTLREDYGYDTWWDYRQVPGKHWWRTIEAAIDDCDAMIVIMTRGARASEWVEKEYEYALERGQDVIPVQVKKGFGPGRWPGQLANQHGVNVAQDYTAGIEALVEALPHLHLEAKRAATPLLIATLFAEAHDHFKAGAYHEALAVLTDCLEIVPEHVEAQNLLKIVKRRIEREKQAPIKPKRASGAGDVGRGELQFAPTEAPKPAPAVIRKTPDFPIPEMVTIPAGPFLMGSDKRKDKNAYDDETPQITVTLPEYQIGKYPVTVEEYRAFVEAGGYSESRWWTDAGWEWREKENQTEPRYWTAEKWTGDPRLPVVGVSWYEAWAYTQWVSDVTREAIRLPTEAEWEKAARGKDGRIYPWGDEYDPERLNSEKRIGKTTPVRQFSPAGDSPYGCADMSGNVFEWCVTKYPFWDYGKGVESMDNRPDGDARRVLRGGSWLPTQDDARAAFRDYDPFRTSGAAMSVFGCVVGVPLLYRFF